WNCYQDKSSKEWVCTGEKGPATGDVAPVEHKPEVAPMPQPSLQETQVNETAPKIDTSTAAKPAEHEIAETAVPTAPAPVSRKPITVKEKLSHDEETRQAGWNCKAADGSENWNCNLTGPDPKGETHIVASEERVFSLLDPAFDAKQEQVFKTLTSNLNYDPWAHCSIEPGPTPVIASTKNLRDVAPLDVKSNYGEVFDNEISSYLGNVEIVRADQRSLSHAAQYDSVSQTLDLQGEVYYSEDNLSLYSNSATLKLASDQATLRNVQFITPSAPFRGRASTVYRESKIMARYKDVAYTSCRPGNTDWVVHASDVKLNDETGRGAAKNAWLEFKGVPVFYSPYLSFPTDSRRQSGFLAPSWGNTQKGGFQVTTPYYWNIAPNYDATLRPRYYGQRGLMLGGDFRLLTKYSEGMAAIQYMPNDQVRHDSRFLGTLQNTSHFGSHIASNMDLNYVSDKEYFGELGNALSFPNFSQIKSTADLSYTDNIKDTGVSLVGRVENWQTLDQTLSSFQRPYRRLPQITFNLDREFALAALPLETNFNSEYVNFQHDDLVDGQRFNFQPSASAPLVSEWGFTTPRVTLQNTNYVLSNQTAGQPDSITRTLPIFSLDNGLFFDRELNLGSSSFKNTLEPRLFYLYIPRKNQTDIPLFDTTYYDYWFANLFRENRFSGLDRTQDANQITAGFTSRLIDDNGHERLKFSLGEIIYFQDREVTAPIQIRYLPSAVKGIPPEGLQTPPETSTFSPLITELSGAITDNWN
ncbi:MAG TPA: LPS assembly protein LptD, partial [Methylomicrobium sp.]|nr:LPS assembly protein LptD [Methylomicrobium sp.]